jgi:potassium-transporting ATPase potassium-binding subunit
VNGAELAQVVLFLAALLLLVRPLGGYMARVYEGQQVLLARLFQPVEALLYRLSGVDPTREMGWREYAAALLVSNFVAFLALYALLRAQGALPLNPNGMHAIAPFTAFNIAVSFVSNTNWQNYGGESTLSYLTQMLGLTTQNFLSAATGMAVLVALIRGLARRSAVTVGNFWVDVTRGVLYVLLPLSVLLGLVLVSQGAVQTLHGARLAMPLQAASAPAASGSQTIAVGPAASQIAIKQLGTNGGGFFNANSAHPFENPTPLSDFLEMLSILLIPAALTYTFGRMVGDRRQGWAVLAAMTALFIVFAGTAIRAEQAGNPSLQALGVDVRASALQGGGNMEGKEVRFGVVNSALWATATTAASNGSVNSMHDSFTPMGGLVPLALIQLGEVVYGGVGSGLYGMLIFVIVAVFVAGLMVGRTPEYLGKKVEPFEMRMAALAILIPSALTLIGSGVAAVTSGGLAGLHNPGPHGLSEMLYAFSSMANNNGSAFAGYGADTPLVNLLGGIAMLFGRYGVIVPTLAIAGSMAGKKRKPESPGTLPTHTPLFVLMLVAVVLVVGALTFFPALALGPVAEGLGVAAH